MTKLKNHLSQLKEIFKEEDRKAAHQKAKSVLNEMALDKEVLWQVVAENLNDPDFWNKKRINPVIAFPIYEDKDITLVAHCFMPRPDGRTDFSHQSIHHHGNLLLSTINCFGAGYESLLFKKGYTIEGDQAFMDLDKEYVNGLYNYEFIDSHTPHIVFYPKELTITYALWCSEKAQAVDQLKKLPFLRQYKKMLRSLIFSLGLGGLFNLNKIEYLDFYAKEGKIIALKDRIRYPECSNDNFIQGLLYVLQKIDFPIDQLKTILTDLELSTSQERSINQLIQKLESGEQIDNQLELPHVFIEKVNLLKSDLNKVIAKKEVI